MRLFSLMGTSASCHQESSTTVVLSGKLSTFPSPSAILPKSPSLQKHTGLEPSSVLCVCSRVAGLQGDMSFTTFNCQPTGNQLAEMMGIMAQWTSEKGSYQKRQGKSAVQTDFPVEHSLWVIEDREVRSYTK